MKIVNRKEKTPKTPHIKKKKKKTDNTPNQKHKSLPKNRPHINTII